MLLPKRVKYRRVQRGRIASRRGFVRINKRTTHITIGVSEKAESGGSYGTDS